MKKQIFLCIAFSIVLKDVFTAASCPSPPVTYASEGDNVTMCWTLLPEARAILLQRFTVMALKRPFEAVMDKVASVNSDGTFFRFYEHHHDGLYVNRVTADANFRAMTLFLRLTNFTSKMENIYCIKYEMSGKDDITNCHSQALILRDTGNNFRSQARTRMEKQIFLRIAFGIVLKDLLTTGLDAYSCPSPPVTYASEGDNVTMCWTLLPEANTVFLQRFSVMALKRPVEAVMEKVASVNSDGTFFRTYENRHDGLYVDGVTADADFQTMELFLRLPNFTRKMENIYCIKYEMSGKDDITTCHSQALILRDIGSQVPKSTVETTTVTVTNRTETKAPPTKGRRVASSDQKTILIILGCLLGVVSVLAILGFMLFCHARKREPLPAKPQGLPVKKV